MSKHENETIRHCTCAYPVTMGLTGELCGFPAVAVVTASGRDYPVCSEHAAWLGVSPNVSPPNARPDHD